MSLYYFLTSNQKLEERGNPYIKTLSVNEALALGIDVDTSLFNEGFDYNQKDVIIYVEKEEDLYYPNIIEVNVNEFEEVKTLHSYMVELEWNYKKKQIPIVLSYIKDHMKHSNEIELWKVWMSNKMKYNKVYKKEITVEMLDEKELCAFFENKKDYACLIIKTS